MKRTTTTKTTGLHTTTREKYLINKHLLLVELGSITDQMTRAMRTANPGYVKDNKFTMNIQDAWNRYIRWAYRAWEAGL